MFLVFEAKFHSPQSSRELNRGTPVKCDNVTNTQVAYGLLIGTKVGDLD